MGSVYLTYTLNHLYDDIVTEVKFLLLRKLRKDEGKHNIQGVLGAVYIVPSFVNPYQNYKE